MSAMPKVIDRRYDFVLLFDVKNGNPNGDPDAGNAPRTDPETGHGLLTDVCLKRKVRDYVTLLKTDLVTGKPESGFRVYVQHRGVLERFHREAYEAEGLKFEEKEKEAKLTNVEKARAWMCQTFYDIRTFGAVLTLDINCGQVRGPVQLAFARSIDPITALEQSIVRKAVATEREAEDQISKHSQITGTMGSKQIIPYALYRVHGFVSPLLAVDTGFTDVDLEVFWQALLNMFEHDRSAARGEMATRKLIVFEHENRLGNAPAHRLFERVRVDRKDSSKPPRDFADYAIRVDASEPPKGVATRVLA
jgi:CRISPR-associated protein Csd2